MVIHRGSIRITRTCSDLGSRAAWPAGTRVRRADEQWRGLTHRVNRTRPLLAQPVIVSHRIRVQGAQPFLALAQRRRGGWIAIGVCGSGAPDARHLEQVRLREPPGVMRRRT
jgi:hypothetical protein